MRDDKSCEPAIKAPIRAAMTDREVAFAMIALIASMFVAMLSNLVVLTAMPRIAADLHATQAHYTWIITSSMLTIAVCTPIWGRISDLLDKKLLMQCCVASYVACSFIASLAQAPWVIIVCRVGIGICAAGIIVLLQTISAAIMSPLKRARWIGYRAAALSVATVGAPSLGGFVTEHLGWRACFLVGIPFAIASIILLQYTLHLPRRSAVRVQIDWPGALLLACGIIGLMLWVSVAGPDRGYFSPVSLGVLAAGVSLILVAVMVELRAPVPILPLELFRRREVVICVIASAAAGVGMFGCSVFLSQYLQIGRGMSPSAAGLMALPEAGGSLVASILTARIISRHGHYKRTLVVGALMLLTGYVFLATIGTTTPLILIAIYVVLLGGGLGVTGETLSIVVQNAVGQSLAGAAGGLTAFFRMLGGIGSVAVLGAVLAAQVDVSILQSGVSGFDPHTVPQPNLLAEPLRSAVESAYAHGIAFVYLLCIPVATIMLVALAALPVGSLSDENPLEQR